MANYPPPFKAAYKIMVHITFNHVTFLKFILHLNALPFLKYFLNCALLGELTFFAWFVQSQPGIQQNLNIIINLQVFLSCVNSVVVKMLSRK